jgi:hypothetical protein
VKSEQEFLEFLLTSDGRAAISKVVNFQLHDEFKDLSFARKAARAFKHKYIFQNETRTINVPTSAIEFTLHVDPFSIKRSDDFARILHDMVKAVAFREDESLVNIVKWSAEAAEAGTTEGLKPIDADYDWDFERLLYPMGESGVDPRFIVFHPDDYNLYARKWMPMGEIEADSDKYSQGIMGYYRPGYFNQSHPVTIMSSRVVEHLRPIILGGSDPQIEYRELPILDIVMTERVSPTLSIEASKSGLLLRLKEEIGICASGKYVQQVRLPEWKEPGFPW